MSVEPEVSEIDQQNSVELNDIVIPALTTRRASTMIELAPGESFMIAGLISDQMETTIDQLPGVSEIPILSALFRSTAYQREETELVLAVTPYLVDPVASGDIKLPTDDFRPASTMEHFFYGALGAINEDVRRLSQTPLVEGPIGFMVD
jgi:pilus assembly protein CpaC